MKKMLPLFGICLFFYVIGKSQSTQSFFTVSASVEGNAVSTGCWASPSIPALMSPGDGSISGNIAQTLTWGTSTSSCPAATISYTYEIYSDPGLTTPYQSGTTSGTSAPLSGIPDGTYYWRVSGVDQFGNDSGFSGAFSFSVDTQAPTVSIGNGNNGGAPENYSGNPYIPLVNNPVNTGPIHGNAYSGTVPIYATIQDPHLSGWHFRIVKDGGSIDSHSCGGAISDPANWGYNKCGYLFTVTGTATKTNEVIASIDTTQLSGDGTYWLILGAIDSLNQRTAGPISAGNYWHSDPRIKIVVDNTAPSVIFSVTGSPTKIVEENVENGSFENGLNEWRTTNDVVTKSSETISSTTIHPTDQSSMARVGETSGTTGNYTWSNRLMQSFPTGARTLSFMYNFYTRDYAYDDPGMFVRINGTDAFHLSSWMINPLISPLAYTGWQRFTYDISGITDPFVNLTISAGNTEDKTKQSWVYVDDITTYYVEAPSHALYSFSGNDTGASYYYKISPATDFSLYTAPFAITTGGSYTLQYYAEDPTGNRSDVHQTTIVTDAIPPATPTDLSVADQSSNSLTLQWTAPGDDGLSGRASRYDLRYSANAISESNFDQATPSATITSPTLSGYTETMRIEGLNPNTTYFVGLNVFDDAGNTSGLISVSGNTLAGENANPGDVIINELIWKGTSVSVYDEWIELRNRTDRVIDLSGWQLTKYLTDTTDVVMYTLPVGAVIQPQGYLVISEFDAVHSALKNEPDLVNGLGNSNDGTFGLSDTNLRIRLLTGTGTLMDIAWDGGAPPALYHQTGVYNSSMERMEAPGNGFERMRWYPCIDEASISEFFDGTGIDFGTPGVKNRSENEPLLYEFFKKATASATLDSSMETDATVAGTMTTTSAVELTYNQKSHTVSFSVTNVQSYVSLSWELAYDIDPSTDSGLQQGVVGKTDVSSLNTYEKTDILLGTCSTGGSCVYHTGVKNIKLNIILKDESGKETVLEKTLENIL